MYWFNPVVRLTALERRVEALERELERRLEIREQSLKRALERL